MHFCTAMIAIEGDKDQTVYRDQFRPISWPEIEILRHVHGDSAVTEVVPFVQVRQDHRAERDRLSLIYGSIPINECWPGRSPHFELDAPEATIASGTMWVDPRTNELDVVPDVAPPPSILTKKASAPLRQAQDAAT